MFTDMEGSTRLARVLGRKGVFHGEAEAAIGASKGYSLTFSIAEQEGGFFFEAQLTKGSEKLEEAGGPLKPTSEKIS